MERFEMTASRRGRIRRVLEEGLRDPVGLLRRAWNGRVKGLLLLATLLPSPARRAILGPFVTRVERLLVGRPDSAILPQLLFVTQWASGGADRVAQSARSLGTSPRSNRRARRELASLALTCGLTNVAADIVASLPDDRLPSTDLLRARINLAAGCYGEALSNVRRAQAGGLAGGRSLAEQAESHLTILQPGWIPELGPHGARLRALRGDVLRGRILHLVTVALPYREAGYTLRTQSVAKCQIEAGLEPHVATRAGFPREEGVVGAPLMQRVDGIPYHRLTPDFRSGGRPDRAVTESARAAALLAEKLRPAVLQPASNYIQAKVARALAEPLGIPVVYEVRGFWEESWAAHREHEADEAMATDRYRLTREAETAEMRDADAIVTLSEVMRAEIVARGCDPQKVVVIPNAVDSARFKPLPRNAGLAASLGIGHDELVVGYISTLNAYEGITYLLEAAAQLRRQKREVRVLLVGENRDERAIAEVVRRTGLDGSLIMTDAVPHDRIVDYYSLIDIFVVPRTNDRVSRLVTPLKPYEAMAMERAVVVSDVPALREIVTPGETGMVFRAEDSADLARTLAGLLDDPALRVRLGRQAREWIVSERTWTHNGRRYRELFERLGAA